MDARNTVAGMDRVKAGRGVGRRGKDPKDRRRNQRMSELRAIHRFAPRFSKITWERFFALLSTSCEGRDPSVVPSDEIGRMLKLSLAIKVDIEEKETARGRTRGRRRRDGKPYRFRITTIAACDKTPDEVEQFYKKRANQKVAERRKVERARRLSTEKAMQLMQTMVQPSSCASLREIPDGADEGASRRAP